MSTYRKSCDNTKKRFKSLMRLYEEIFYYGCEVDRWLPEITLLPYVSLQWRIDPTWYRIIGPPGCGKSKHLTLLENYELTYSVDSFTPKSFVSGYRGDGEDPSQLPLFDGKVLIVSDESTFMEQRQDERNTVQSILRRAYDGKIAKSFGNLKEKQSYYAHFNFLIGSTPQVDRYFLYQQALGERYINYRLQVPNRRAIAERAFENQFKDFNKMFARLNKRVHQFLRRLPDVEISAVPISRDIKDLIIGCSNFIALIRTHVNRDASGRHVTTLPQPECAGRLVKQITQTAIASAVLQGDPKVMIKHVDKAIYLGVGSITAVIAFILYHIYNFTEEVGRNSDKAWFTVQYMVIRTALGRASTMRILEDFAIHHILDIRQGKTKGGRLIEYALNKSMYDTIDGLGLFDKYIPPCSKILNLKRLDKTRPTGNKPYAKKPHRRRRSK